MGATGRKREAERIAETEVKKAEKRGDGMQEEEKPSKDSNEGSKQLKKRLNWQVSSKANRLRVTT